MHHIPNLQTMIFITILCGSTLTSFGMEHLDAHLPEALPVENPSFVHNGIIPRALMTNYPQAYNGSAEARPVVYDQHIPTYDQHHQLIEPQLIFEDIPQSERVRQTLSNFNGGMNDQGILLELTGIEPLSKEKPTVAKRIRPGTQVPDSIDFSTNVQDSDNNQTYIQKQNARLMAAQSQVESMLNSLASDDSVVAQYKNKKEMINTETIRYLQSQSAAMLAELLLSSPIRARDGAQISKSRVLSAITANMADSLGITATNKVMAEQIKKINATASKSLDVIFGERSITDDVKQSRINQLLASIYTSLQFLIRPISKP